MFYTVLFAVLLGAEPDFEVAQERSEDRVEVHAQEERVVFTVASPRGIGEASIRCRRALWPKAVVLRLHLCGLESLTITASPVTWGASVSSSAPQAVRLHVSETGKQQEKAVDRHSPYWTQLRILNADGKPAAGLPGPGGWFELQLPAALLAGQPKAITIRWIDFYRD